jgi:hypothetical protein
MNKALTALAVASAAGMFYIGFTVAVCVAAEELPAEPAAIDAAARTDWLIDESPYRAGLYRGAGENEIVMSNSLVRRVFRISPNGATVGLDNMMTGAAMLRGVKPETKVALDGKEYAVGGLTGQVEYAYLLPEWLGSMKSDPAAFQFAGFETGKPKERFAWKRARYSEGRPWPPLGVSLSLKFKPPAGAPESVEITVHYEMYDGIPLISKWLTISNNGMKPVRLNKFTSEILAVVDYETSPDAAGRWENPNMHVESDYAFAGMMAKGADHTTVWGPDAQYTSQVDYNLTAPLLMESRPPIGPDADIAPGGVFESFRTFELVYDSTERERKGLALRRMYRTIAPWATENPILMHERYSDYISVKTAIDQSAAVGFEMVIITFWSGFDAENENPEYIKMMKKLADYAHRKGIELGGYSLLASRKISEEDDVINPKTMKTGGAIFGDSPCLVSKWGEKYFNKIANFYEKTGFDVLEHDGSYPGDVCASTKHPGHRGLEDSQWMQWKKITEFYHFMRERGVYLNVPDWYFLNGSNKTGMGYREVNWSLPRDRQVILGRQNIYDGTWEKTPSMGWMFVPLMQYHGGGDEATLEPLSQHLDTYDAILAQNFGSGVQACYRGSRLFDTKETKAVVKKWADFYKAHRAILDSDIIHLRRPDGRDIDAILHVNPKLKEKGLAFFFNPLDRAVRKKLSLPIYYTGLTDTASIREKDGAPKQYKLDRNYNVEIEVDVPANGYSWFVIE